jgi:hypothetical protein
MYVYIYMCIYIYMYISICPFRHVLLSLAEDPDELEGEANMAWSTYRVNKARKLEPFGDACHYCATVKASMDVPKFVEQPAQEAQASFHSLLSDCLCRCFPC